MATVTVTSRSRNIGFGWTNQPVQTRTGLAIQTVSAPDVVGTPCQVLAEMQRTARSNNSNDWRWELYIGGRRVCEFDDETGSARRHAACDLLDYLCTASYASAAVEVE